MPFADDISRVNALIISHRTTRLPLALLTLVNVMDAIIFDIYGSTVMCCEPCITANLICDRYTPTTAK